MLAAVFVRAAEPITLRFSVWDGDESLKVIRKVLSQFESEHPGIKVKLENYADYNMYHQKMLVTYAGNNAPDVAMMDMGHFQALANRKALLPLNSFFASTPGFKIADYYKPIVDASSLDGQLYILPRDIAPEGLIYYNKRMFREKGIPFPDGSWTWDFKERPELKEKDFLWVMHKLTEPDPKGGKPKTYGFISGWPGLCVDTFMYSYGLSPVDNLQHPTKLLYDSPDMRKVYDLYIDLALKKKWMPSNTEVSSVLQSTTTQLFVSEKVAMYQNGIWEVPNVRKMMKPGDPKFFDWDIALYPSCARDITGKPRRAFPTGGSGYSIFSSTAHPKEAWELTRYMSGPVGMKAMAAAGIAQPAIRSIALSSAWLPGPDTPEAQRYPANRLATDQAVPFVTFGITADYYPEIGSMVDSQRDSIYNGIKPVQQGLKEGSEQAQVRLNQLLKEETLPTFSWSAGLIAAIIVVASILGAIYWPERNVRYTNREKKESRTAYKFLAPWLIGIAVFTVGPMVLSLLMSTMKWDMIAPAQFRGTGNFREAFVDDPRFWISLRVTLLFTVLSTPIGIFCSFLLAMLLNQKVKGVALFRSMYYMPSITSAVAMALIARKLFSPDGGLVNAVLYSPLLKPFGDLLSRFVGTPGEQVNWFSNEHTAMPTLIIWGLLGIGGSMIILLAGLQGIPQYYYEAATMDGASPFQRVKAITVPLLTPSLFFCLVTGFIGAFQVFTQVYIITNGPNGGPNNSMLVFMISVFSAAFTTLRMGYAAALAWVLFFVVLFFTMIQMRMSKWVHYEAEAK